GAGGPLGPEDGQRRQDRPAPGGDLVDVDSTGGVEQKHLGRDGGRLLTVEQVEVAEVDFRVTVGRFDTAELHRAAAGPRQGDLAVGRADELEGGVGLDGGGAIVRASGEDAPAACRGLAAQDTPGGLAAALDGGGIPSALDGRI